MSNKSVFCISGSAVQADRIVSDLKAASFTSDDIAALFADDKSTRAFAHEKNTKAPEGIATGAGTGGVIGGTLGLLAGIGALAIPGVGPFIAAGPFMAALGGAAVGATVGGIAGGLIGMGIPELEARRYEDKLKKGNVLLSVHTESSDEVNRAKAIFSRDGGTDICVADEGQAPQRDDDDDDDDYDVEDIDDAADNDRVLRPYTGTAVGDKQPLT